MINKKIWVYLTKAWSTELSLVMKCNSDHMTFKTLQNSSAHLKLIHKYDTPTKTAFSNRTCYNAIKTSDKTSANHLFSNNKQVTYNNHRVTIHSVTGLLQVNLHDLRNVPPAQRALWLFHTPYLLTTLQTQATMSAGKEHRTLDVNSTYHAEFLLSLSLQLDL